MKKLSSSIGSLISKKTGGMATFKVTTQTESSAILRTDTGDSSRLYEFDTTVVLKPSSGKTRWLVLPK